MEELEIKIYLKVLLKNWKLIILFTIIALILSSFYNIILKKAPIQEYHAEGNINVTNVVLTDKTTPSVILDGQGQMNLFEKVEQEIKINKADYNIQVDTSTPNIVKISGSSLKGEDLAKYINGILEYWTELYKDKYGINENETLNLLDKDERDKILDSTGKTSLSLIQEEIKALDDKEAKSKEKINKFNSNIETNKYNIDLANYQLNKLKQRVLNSSGIEHDESVKKYVDIEYSLDSYMFYDQYYRNELSNTENDLKQVKKLKPIYNSLLNNRLVNDNIVITNTTAIQTTSRDTRVRSIIVSVVLVFLIMCCYSIVKEYFYAGKHYENERSL